MNPRLYRNPETPQPLSEEEKLQLFESLPNQGTAAHMCEALNEYHPHAVPAERSGVVNTDSDYLWKIGYRDSEGKIQVGQCDRYWPNSQMVNFTNSVTLRSIALDAETEVRWRVSRHQSLLEEFGIEK